MSELFDFTIWGVAPLMVTNHWWPLKTEVFLSHDCSQTHSAMSVDSYGQESGKAERQKGSPWWWSWFFRKIFRKIIPNYVDTLKTRMKNSRKFLLKNWFMTWTTSERVQAIYSTSENCGAILKDSNLASYTLKRFAPWSRVSNPTKRRPTFPNKIPLSTER